MDDTADQPAGLVLGTRQLGMAYGIANRIGAPGAAEAQALLTRARALGIVAFDTARNYGQSEARLGQAFRGASDVRILTKLPPLETLAPDTPARIVIDAVRANIAASAEALGTARLDTVLLHNARHLRSHNGAIWDTLLNLHAEGRIGALGTSVQTPDELRLAFSYRAISHVQLPLNILDWRWRDPALLDLFPKRPDITVHARSVYLQGLLAANDPGLWPATAGLDVAGLVKALDALTQIIGRENTADLCLAYARAMPFLQGIVVGVETREQLEVNWALAARPPLDPDETLFVERFLPRIPVCLLDPTAWPTAKAA